MACGSVTNGEGAYTAPTPATTGQTRDRRRITLARNIIKNWLPAANGLLAIADAAVNLRLGVQLDAMVRCMTANASVDDHYDVLLAESLVNGYDFVLYAGPQWDNSTDGYYGAQAGNAITPVATGRSTPSTRTLLAAHPKATPAVPIIRTSPLLQTGSNNFSIGCVNSGNLPILNG